MSAVGGRDKQARRRVCGNRTPRPLLCRMRRRPPVLAVGGGGAVSSAGRGLGMGVRGHPPPFCNLLTMSLWARHFGLVSSAIT